MGAIVELDDLTTWAKTVIEGTPDAKANKVYAYRRRIANDDQLSAAFGTGTLDEDRAERLRGWFVTVTRRAPEQTGHPTALVDYTMEYTCLWTLYDYGASEADFRRHVASAAAQLTRTVEPTALQARLSDGKEYELKGVFPVVIAEIAIVRWPPGIGRLAHRAELTQIIRFREGIRGA